LAFKPLETASAHQTWFSVNLEANVYPCFDVKNGSQGDVIDLWAALSWFSVIWKNRLGEIATDK
jgi:hypothetical protein